MTCPFLAKEATNHRYDIMGNLIDYELQDTCTMTGGSCQYCTAISISNRNRDSKITLYRPDGKRDLIFRGRREQINGQ